MAGEWTPTNPHDCIEDRIATMIRNENRGLT
jgi:hypothetical protein